MPDAPPHPAGLGWVGGKLPAVGPDCAPGMTDLEELKHPVRQHYEFETVVVRVQARISGRITIDRTSASAGRVLGMKRHAIRTLLANSGLEPFFSKRRKGRSIPERVRHPVEAPYTR